MGRTTLSLLLLALPMAAALNPVLRAAGVGMQALRPVFTLENRVQAAVLGRVGSVDVDDVKAEIAAAIEAPAVVYTYGLSPFSSEAVAALEATGARFDVIEVGPEWFLLGPRASVLRGELEALTGQSSLPHVFIGGEHVGGLATGPDGGLAGLDASGALVAKLRAAKAM